MIALLDTDVLLGVALDREPHAESADDLLDALEKRRATAFIAWHSISNFYYLVRPSQGNLETKVLLLDLARFVRVASTTTESLLYAAQLEMSDLEDAMQVAAATACEADVIVTRNLRDYRKSPIRAAEPRDVLLELA